MWQHLRGHSLRRIRVRNIPPLSIMGLVMFESKTYPSLENIVDQLQQRIHRLERALRAAVWVGGSVILFLLLSFASDQYDEGDKEHNIIRARGISIVDEKGRERIAIGAPMPDPAGYGKRTSASTGMAINDANGYERFGVGLDEAGNMQMGFDAPPGNGDPRNPERINIVADAGGGGFIRFVNKKTEVVSFLRLDENDEFCLEFLDRKTGKIMRRQMRYSGEKTVEWK
jgi:hypothetical protein